MGLKDSVITSLKVMINDNNSIDNFKERVDFSSMFILYLIVVGAAVIFGYIIFLLLSFFSGFDSEFLVIVSLVFLGSFIVALVIPFLYSAILHVIFLLFGAKGTYKDTLIVGFSLGFSSTVTNLLIQIGTTFFLFIAILFFPLIILLFLILLAYIVWLVYISVKLFAKVHSISLWYSFFAHIVFLILIFIILALVIKIISILINSNLS